MGKRVWFPRVSGPLALYAAGLEAWLRSRSYSPSAVANRMCQLDQLSCWLERQGLGAVDLTEARAAEFATSRREAGLVTWTSPQSVALPLAYLREIGVMLTLPATVASSPLEELLADYGRYLRVERRLSEHTVRDAYLPAARLFLAGREGPDGLGLARLSAADVSMFLVAECAKRSVTGARDLASALRSFLRFLHLAGLVDAPLMWAVPSVADVRDRTLPRGLEPAAVCELLASCDRRRTVGRRDYAIVLLLARPVDVGEAIVSYLRRRPRCESRALFLRMTAPLRGWRHIRSGGSCARRAPGRGFRASALTGCGTPRRPRCSGRARRWRRSDRCCAIASRRRQRYTPRSTAGRSARSRVRGPRRKAVRHDAPRSARRLSAPAPPARVRDAPGRPAA